MVTKSPRISSPTILSTVDKDSVFRFCTSEGVFTNVTADSLPNFAEKLDGIDETALLFHYPRGDFQAWIKNVIGDNELADRLCFITPNLPGEKLRTELKKMVQRRIQELTAIPMGTA